MGEGFSQPSFAIPWYDVASTMVNCLIENAYTYIWICFHFISAVSVDSSQSIVSTSSSLFSSSQDKQVDYNGLDFRIIVDSKSGASPPVHITLVASSLQEKAAWCSDISQVTRTGFKKLTLCEGNLL